MKQTLFDARKFFILIPNFSPSAVWHALSRVDWIQGLNDECVVVRLHPQRDNLKVGLVSSALPSRYRVNFAPVSLLRRPAILQHHVDSVRLHFLPTDDDQLPDGLYHPLRWFKVKGTKT